MKTLGAVLLFACLAQEDSSARRHEWTRIALPVTDDLTAIRFVDPMTGWLLSQGGAVLRTNDGGLTWKVQRPAGPSKRYRPFEHLWFQDERRGRIAECCNECDLAGPATVAVYATEDGGEHWAPVKKEDGMRDTLLKPWSFTPRTGETWARFHFSGVYVAPAAGQNYAIANHHAALKDFGRMFDTSYEDFCFADADRGALAGRSVSGPLLLLTWDGGRTWLRRKVPGLVARSISRVWMSPSAIRFVADESPCVWASTDGGASWKTEWPGRAGDQPFELYFLERDFGFAFGRGGLLLRYAAR
ncbi:MAG: hypothetical protein HY293_03200 [Planctomycetes bacterium]|nr:hypothetical protein [Planctomycetota bacterium]